MHHVLVSYMSCLEYLSGGNMVVNSTKTGGTAGKQWIDASDLCWFGKSSEIVLGISFWWEFLKGMGNLFFMASQIN